MLNPIHDFYSDFDTALVVADYRREIKAIEEKSQARAKELFKLSERVISIKQQPVVERERPTDRVKLKAVLDKESDQTLLDWFNALLREPTVFRTEPPDWLSHKVARCPRKCHDLLDAIGMKIRRSKDFKVRAAMKVYHGNSKIFPSKPHSIQSGQG